MERKKGCAVRLNQSAVTFWLLVNVLFFGALLVLPVGAQSGVEAYSQLNSLSVAQIRSLAKEKMSWTATQKKIDSNLLLAEKLRSDASFQQSLPALQISAEIDSDATVLVDIKASVSAQLLAEIEALGGTVQSSYPHYNAIRARMPLAQLESLAENEDVSFVGRAEVAFLNKSNTSEGDVAHSAASSRSSYGIDGSGIKIGVLSDSVDNLAEVQASGDLPDVTVLEDYPGETGEGTAMLEIVHDLAPGAELYFATAWTSKAGFASNILALADAGCQIIVDDVFYFSESPFQDDILSQAVNTVTANGVLYFSAAGNSGNLNDGTAKVWEGDYAESTSVPSSLPGYYTSVLDFGSGDVTNDITTDTSSFYVMLFWNDPLGAAGNDYDLFLLDSSGNVVAAGSDTQDGDDDPFEYIGSSSFNAYGYRLVVAKYSGDDRFIHLSTVRGQLEHQTMGQIVGHPAAEDAFGVAAVRAYGMDSAFSGSESVETYSSDGPRRVFYEADGTPITSGDLTATGGRVRQKPDIAAADCVQTATPGFAPFCGTSAAAPHAAALTALLLEKYPDLTREKVKKIFAATALDIEDAGYDRDSGAGLLMADRMLDRLMWPSFFPWPLFWPAIQGSQKE